MSKILEFYLINIASTNLVLSTGYKCPATALLTV